MTNRTNCPFVASAHVRYVDFVGDFEATGQPSLTSFVRDPLMKARSRFYFRRSVRAKRGKILMLCKNSYRSYCLEKRYIYAVCSAVEKKKIQVSKI